MSTELHWGGEPLQWEGSQLLWGEQAVVIDPGDAIVRHRAGDELRSGASFTKRKYRRLIAELEHDAAAIADAKQRQAALEALAEADKAAELAEQQARAQADEAHRTYIRDAQEYLQNALELASQVGITPTRIADIATRSKMVELSMTAHQANDDSDIEMLLMSIH